MSTKFIKIPEDPAEKKKFFTVLICAICALIAAAIIIGSILGVVSNKIKEKKEKESLAAATTVQQGDATPTTEPVTKEEAPYSPGAYTVAENTRIRQTPVYDATNGNVIRSVAAGQMVNITEIKKSDDLQYTWWGYVEKYQPEGSDYYYNGYICMNFLTLVEAATEKPTTATSGFAYTQPGDYVTVAGLNLRSGSGATYDQLAEIPQGTSVKITEVVDLGESVSTDRYWGKTAYNGIEGYISMSYVSKSYPSSVKLPKAEETTVEVTDTSLFAPGKYTAKAIANVRSSTDAALDNNLLGQLAVGDTVEVVRIVQTSKTVNSLKYWGEIEFHGQTAYVSMSSLEKNG